MVEKKKLEGPGDWDYMEYFEERGDPFSTYFLRTGSGIDQQIPVYLTAFLNMLFERGEDVVSVFPNVAGSYTIVDGVVVVSKKI